MTEEKNNNVQSKVIGARKLTDEEITLILPTYDRIQNQIEEIRSESVKINDGKAAQRINNIGIMGARGTGKTSIIKTLIDKLERQNNENEKIKNIILPMIIPENMSESMNLMSTILGLFKSVVDEIEKEQNKESRDCWEKPKRIKEFYDELIKKYCYVQRDYRDILVKNYSTENDYMKHSAEVFNSDIEFDKSFNDLINMIIGNEKYSEDAMIFLFIDDIDLSTSRCVDVVKTLLAYIVNPRIITIISGDMDTFEEALTLDFLRQEKALEGSVLNKRFGSKNSLLEGKKELAYEYLKKIIPPAYRHNVKVWTIEDRGNYIINSGNQKASSLGELLDELFGNEKFGCMGFFRYCKESEWRSKDFHMYNVPQVYHMFDSTSRGLNNIYNVLINEKNSILEYVADDTEENERRAFSSVKLILETIVSTNAILNRERQQIFDHIICFGSSFSTTEIKTDNLARYKNDDKYSSVSQFTVLLFVEFARRILFLPDKSILLDNDQEYSCKDWLVKILLEHPEISGYMSVNHTEWENTENENTKNELYDLLKNAEFVFVLQYIQFMNWGKDEINTYLTKDKNEEIHAKALLALRSLEKMYKMEKINSIIPKTIDELLTYNNYSTDEGAYNYEKVFKFSEIIDNLLKKVKPAYFQCCVKEKREYLFTDEGDTEKDLIYKIIIKEQYLWANWLVSKFKTFDKDVINLPEEDKRRMQIVRYLSDNNLWQSEDVIEIRSKISSKKKEIFKTGDVRLDDLNIKLSDGFMETYKQIKDKNVTVTRGGFDILKSKIKRITKDGAKNTISIIDYCDMIGSFESKYLVSEGKEEKATIKGFLANEYLRAGREYVYQLFTKCNESSFVKLPFIENNSEKAWLACYMEMEKVNINDNIEISQMLAEVTDMINKVVLFRKDSIQENIFESGNYDKKQVYELFGIEEKEIKHE